MTVTSLCHHKFRIGEFLGFLSAIFLISLSSEGADWSLKVNFTNSDDSTICKFDIPIKMLPASLEYLSSLPAGCGGTINIDGDLILSDQSTLATVERFYTDHPTALRPGGIAVNSNGGSIVTALAIAKSIRSPKVIWRNLPRE